MFLCRVALLAAAYFVLSITLTIKTPYLEITFKSLPVVVGALMFGPVGGGLVAFFGELLAQMIGPYGLMPTTVLWLLPPLTRGLLLGAVATIASLMLVGAGEMLLPALGVIVLGLVLLRSKLDDTLPKPGKKQEVRV